MKHRALWESFYAFWQKGYTLSRFRLKTWVWHDPDLYGWLIAYFRPHRRSFCVGPETEICIEGFPRSGNSFVVMAFQLAQRRPVRIAHHQHVPAQILRAIRWHIPVLLLIRDPFEAVLSLKALHLEILLRKQRRSLEYGIPFKDLFRAYVAFYRPLIPVLDACVVAPFSQATRDLGGFIHAVNRKFGTSFTPFDLTPENLQKVRERLGFHAFHTDIRDKLKEILWSEFQRSLEEDPRTAEWLIQAHRVYQEVLQRATTPTKEVG